MQNHIFCHAFKFWKHIEVSSGPSVGTLLLYVPVYRNRSSFRRIVWSVVLHRIVGAVFVLGRLSGSMRLGGTAVVLWLGRIDYIVVSGVKRFDFLGRRVFFIEIHEVLLDADGKFPEQECLNEFRRIILEGLFGYDLQPF